MLRKHRELRFASVALIALALAGCRRSGAPAEDPATVSGDRAPDHGTHDRVFLEAALVVVPAGEVGSLGAHRFSDVAARRDGSVLSAPHMLLDCARSTRFEMDGAHWDGHAAGATYTWDVEPNLIGEEGVRLSLDVAVAGGSRVARTTLDLHDGQTVIAPTTFPLRSGDTLVVLLRPEVVRGPQDLQAIYERKRLQ